MLLARGIQGAEQSNMKPARTLSGFATDKPSAEMAIEAVERGNGLEEATISLLRAHVCGRVSELRALEYRSLRDGREREATANLTIEKSVDHRCVFLLEHRAGRVDKLTARTHTPRRLGKQGKLQAGHVVIDIFRQKAPGNLGVATHGARAGAGRVYKHAIEEVPLPCPTISFGKGAIKVATVTGDEADAIDEPCALEASAIQAILLL